MKFTYSKDYSPLAPVFPVKIAPPGGASGEENFIALVDTGADGTFVPISTLEAMDLPILYMTNVKAHMSERLHRVPIYLVDFVLFDTLRLPNIEVVADEWGDQVILGRNLLNKIHIHLDGPNEVATILE